MNGREFIETSRVVIRKVRDAFKHAFGDGKGKARRNPWPLCKGLVYHRVPAVCLYCRLCDTCQEHCEECGRCNLVCPGHKEKEDAR
jgi:hypothetical protein